MKVEVTTNAKGVEVANCILGRAIESLRNNPELLENFGLTNNDVHLASTFRKQLISRSCVWAVLPLTPECFAFGRDFNHK